VLRVGTLTERDGGIAEGRRIWVHHAVQDLDEVIL